MSRKLPRLIAACCLVILVVPISVFAEEIWQNFDDGDLSMWQVHHGTWIANAGAYEQTDYSGPNYQWTVLNWPIGDGWFEFDVTVIDKNQYTTPFGSFGVMWKYIDGNNYCRSRWGSYRMADAYERVAGQGYEVKLGAVPAGARAHVSREGGSALVEPDGEHQHRRRGARGGARSPAGPGGQARTLHGSPCDVRQFLRRQKRLEHKVLDGEYTRQDSCLCPGDITARWFRRLGRDLR